MSKWGRIDHDGLGGQSRQWLVGGMTRTRSNLVAITIQLDARDRHASTRRSRSPKHFRGQVPEDTDFQVTSGYHARGHAIASITQSSNMSDSGSGIASSTRVAVLPRSCRCHFSRSTPSESPSASASPPPRVRPLDGRQGHFPLAAAGGAGCAGISRPAATYGVKDRQTGVGGG